MSAIPCLQYIDRYDDTVFTGLQMQAFLPDWRRLSELAVTLEEKKFASEVEILAKRCQSPAPELFLYLKYFGD